MAGRSVVGSRIRVFCRRAGAVATAVALAMVAVVPAGSAAPGDLDPTFGDGGIVRTQVSDPTVPDPPVPDYPGLGAGGVVVQADGKTLAAGPAYDASGNSVFGLVRYLDGELAGGDEVSVSLSSPFGYANAGTLTVGDLSVVQDQHGVKTVTGTGRIPANPGPGGTAVSFNVRRITIFFFRIYVGSVGVVDASADINQTTVQLFGTVSPAGANGANGAERCGSRSGPHSASTHSTGR